MWMNEVIILRKMRGDKIPNISAQKLSLIGPSTGSEDERSMWCLGTDVVIAHATVIQVSVALPSLTMCRVGRERI